MYATAIFDKTGWLSEHGVSEEWPVAGLPELVDIDNGPDLKSAAFQRACENEGIRIDYRPRGSPHFGGRIERLMETMMQDVHTLPGTTFSSMSERGRKIRRNPPV